MTAFLKEYIDMGVILAVVILNAIIGFTQEYKAEESVKALKRMVVPRARVLRNGREREINSEDLVPGDIVFLSSGLRVPAIPEGLPVREAPPCGRGASLDYILLDYYSSYEFYVLYGPYFLNRQPGSFKVMSMPFIGTKVPKEGPRRKETVL